MGMQPSVQHYSADRVPNPYPGGDLPWQAYHTVRNAVFRCCRMHGRAGPMGECPITEDAEIPSKDWHSVDGPGWLTRRPRKRREPLDYFVVDDQYNHERYIYVEVVRAGAFTEQWLRDLMRTLCDHDGWGVGIMGLPNAYMLVFADKLMITGKTFEQCHDFDCVVRQGQEALAASRQSGDAR